MHRNKTEWKQLVYKAMTTDFSRNSCMCGAHCLFARIMHRQARGESAHVQNHCKNGLAQRQLNYTLDLRSNIVLKLKKIDLCRSTASATQTTQNSEVNIVWVVRAQHRCDKTVHIWAHLRLRKIQARSTNNKYAICCSNATFAQTIVKSNCTQNSDT